MLPFEEAREVRKSILSYIASQYPVSDPAVRKKFGAFLEHPEEGLFNDFSISLGLPFRQISDAECRELGDFLRVLPGFVPYRHQAEAFRRLGSWNYRTDTPRSPEPVLLATGTGSGKTEGFLYPVLDYCLRENQKHHRKGVKVIIMYPMNALATDQAQRLAREIMRLPRDENGNLPVTAGLLIGNGRPSGRTLGKNARKKSIPPQVTPELPRDMGEDHIIENRDAILDTVPDIILTNFKMLDRALTLREYHDLWTGNVPERIPGSTETGSSEEPEFSPCLKFLVLDEIHTYDGAQGSDVANLIRRLKLKLGLSRGQLCPVGTSATMGSPEDVICYARKLFGEEFSRDSVIFENRVSPQEFLGREDVSSENTVNLAAVTDPGLAPEGMISCSVSDCLTSRDVFLDRLSRIWLPDYEKEFPEPLTALKVPDSPDCSESSENLSGEIVRRAVFRGKCLKGNPLFRIILGLASAGSVSFGDLCSGIRDSPEFVSLIRWSRNSGDPGTGGAGGSVSADLRTFAETVTGQFLDLIAGSLAEGSSPERQHPFLFNRVTMWVRELSSVAREVSRLPGFVFVRRSRNSGTAAPMPSALPFWCCRKCGGSGWVTLRDETGDEFSRDFRRIGKAFMARDKEVRLLVPMNTPGDREFAGKYADLPELEISYKAPETDGARLGGAGCTVFGRMRIRSTDLRFDREDSFNSYLRDPRFVNVEEAWTNWVPVYEYSFTAKENGVERFVPKCPFCLARDTVSIAGSHVSYLSATALNAVMSSAADSTDPDSRKLLVFSNAVQNATFLSGVYEDRSYRFCFRKAMAECFALWRKEHAASGSPESGASSGIPGLSLRQFSRDFISHFEKQYGCSDSELSQDFIYNFRPPMEPMRFRFEEIPEESPEDRGRFKKAFLNRMEWECVNEFAGGSDDGRSLEISGTLAAGFDPEMVRTAASLIQERLYASPELSGFDSFEKIRDERRLAGFIESILQRFRIRGVIDNPYIAPFRDNRIQDVYSYRLKTSGSGDDAGPDRFHELTPKFNFYNFPRIAVVDDDRVRNDKFGFFETLKTNESSRYYELFYRAFVHGEEFRTVNLPHYIQEFYRELLEAMTEAGLLQKLNAGVIGDDPALYVISQDAVLLSEKADVRYCPACLYRERVPEFSRNPDFRICPNLKKHEPDGNRSPDRDCLLEKLPEDNSGEDYYRDLYTSGYRCRINAREHTGLLDRSVRENIEDSFRSSGAPGAVNVLSATSTLEMGIDIGDLNTVFLAGLPDSAAGYLQRIGRAGRASGNSLVVNFARSSSKYDLYAFENPGYLTDGQIVSPGCYLKSPDILKRHFLAFCFDRAALESFAGGDASPCLPGIFSVKDGRMPAFVSGISGYISKNRDDLLRKFREVCIRESGEENPESLRETEKAFEELERQVSSGMLVAAVTDAFAGLISKIACLNTRKDCYLEERNRAEKSCDKFRFRSMNAYLAAVNDKIGKLAEQDAQGFLAEQGLLPNYAFPEKGVTLTGEILDFSERANGKNLSSETFTVTEPAENALTALAPDNTFYFNHHRMTVLGIDPAAFISDSKKKVFTPYRYCNVCAALAPAGTPEFDGKTCPKCGDPNWENNRHLFMNMPDMVSEMLREDASLLGRNREEREQEHYIVKSHFDFDYSGPRLSFSLPETGFGAEFFGRITLRMANYGNAREITDDPDAVVDGEKVPRMGFVVCTSCGKATSLWNFHRDMRARREQGERGTAPKSRGFARPEDLHFRFCRCADKTEPDAVIPGTDRRVFAETYLLRELNTEGVRIRLPNFASLTGNISNFRHLIMAGIRLGLKSWFRGSPDHLAFDFCSENAESVRNEYIVIYDRVPGGTGYLRELCSKNPATGKLVFLEILEKGLQALRDCSCEDGCYSCVYHYGSQVRGTLSRSRAVMIMEALVKIAGSSGFRECRSGRGLSDLGAEDPCDSIFEANFVELMQEIAEDHQDSFGECRDPSGTVMNGVWIWEGRREEHPSGSAVRVIEFRYRITQQADPEGLHVRGAPLTRPDFLFEPEEYCVIENGERRTPDLRALYRIALYLDGYRYHGDLYRGEVRFFKDLAIREALRKGNRYREEQYLPWTMTWNDLSGRTPGVLPGLLRQPKFPTEDQFARHFRSDFAETRKEILALNTFYGNSGRSTMNPFSEPVDQFLFVLLHPEPEYLKRIFFDLLWGMTEPGASASLVLADSVTAAPYLAPDRLMERKQACQQAIQEDRSRMSGLFSGRYLTLLSGNGQSKDRELPPTEVPPVWFSRGPDAVPEPYCINVRMNYPGTPVSVHKPVTDAGTPECGLARTAWETFWQLYNMFAILPRYHEAAGEELPDDGSAPAGHDPAEPFGYTIENLQNFFVIPPGIVPARNQSCTPEALEDNYGGDLMEVMTLLADTGLLGPGFTCGHGMELEGHYAEFISESLKLAVAPDAESRDYFGQQGYCLVLSNHTDEGKTVRNTVTGLRARNYRVVLSCDFTLEMILKKKEQKPEN